MKAKPDSITHRRDFTVLHRPGERERVLATIAEAEKPGGDLTQNCLDALENAGFKVILDGAFRVMDDGQVVTDADYVLGQVERGPEPDPTPVADIAVERSKRAPR
jgi:hypothetical protein